MLSTISILFTWEGTALQDSGEGNISYNIAVMRFNKSKNMEMAWKNVKFFVPLWKAPNNAPLEVFSNEKFPNIQKIYKNED